MKVMKFGGTSVGKPQRMKEVAQLINADKETKIVVLSALSGTTNALVEISNVLANGDRYAAQEKINALEAHYRSFVNELLSKDAVLQKASKLLSEHFEFLNIILKISFSEALNKDILAQYVEYITNLRMSAVGLTPAFVHATQNPIPWINAWLSSDNVQVAPQEVEVSSYLVGQINAEINSSDLSDFEL